MSLDTTITKLLVFARSVLESDVTMKILLFLYKERFTKRERVDGKVVEGEFYVREIIAQTNSSPKDCVRRLKTLLQYRLVEREIVREGGREYHYYKISKLGEKLIEALLDVIEDASQ